ncbi:sigma-54-dependent transcriptional regulator [Mucilaginibacter pedocola]|uniref:Fis family transcriptional regulator n=1 Tax=Mucilaginibacter pedocola TaxID=1792845 RepID=A0A1S9P9W3_9SPHI|nr:sigma-54 dependent transcriptional regulator [Mucilaginibacter pedocola]OOQ57773.1 Fis family transcriptional regulator [Mucilaginibacter pedocola]
MKRKVLIVEDEFIEASGLERVLEKAGFAVMGIAMSVAEALKMINREKPDVVLLDIRLKGPENGIQLAQQLKAMQIAFVFLSANSNSSIFDEAKKTEPYGFLVKPFRERDVLSTLNIAAYLHEQKQKLNQRHQAILEEKFVQAPGIKGIIGESHKILHVLNLIKVVAPVDTSVLILGESGTGKELIVDSIHHLSKRRAKPLVKINCAALPQTLIESELFGHERGAFTGAVERRIGKFEQAHGGTIFLDEIGDMPADLQVKLLRVLQEKEIERLGGKGTITVDVRVIAATNKNLEKEVAKGTFRMDLYYRLNVFPVTLPPLRERKEDIPLLAAHFITTFNKRLSKNIGGLSTRAMAALIDYNWPGNVRELEHLIERHMLLADGKLINHIELPSPATYQEPESGGGRVKTMEENDIDHIIKVLKLAKGKLAGPGGAAEMLNLPYSTLASKIKKLGIKKNDISG